MKDLLYAMRDRNEWVRGSAGSAVRRMLGADFGFEAELSTRDRAAIDQKLAVWRDFKQAHGALVAQLVERLREEER